MLAYVTYWSMTSINHWRSVATKISVSSSWPRFFDFFLSFLGNVCCFTSKIYFPFSIFYRENFRFCNFVLQSVLTLYNKTQGSFDNVQGSWISCLNIRERFFLKSSKHFIWPKNVWGKFDNLKFCRIRSMKIISLLILWIFVWSTFWNISISVFRGLNAKDVNWKVFPLRYLFAHYLYFGKTEKCDWCWFFSDIQNFCRKTTGLISAIIISMIKFFLQHVWQWFVRRLYVPLIGNLISRMCQKLG